LATGEGSLVGRGRSLMGRGMGRGNLMGRNLMGRGRSLMRSGGMEWVEGRDGVGGG
jgi:hypothetical protein